MRELLGELLLEVNEPAAALVAFEASLQRGPNRFRSLSGAAGAAELVGNREKANAFYAKLVALADQADTARPSSGTPGHPCQVDRAPWRLRGRTFAPARSPWLQRPVRTAHSTGFWGYFLRFPPWAAAQRERKPTL